MTAPTLPEFILARVAEDEAMARAVQPLGFSVDMGGHRHDDRFTHGRMGFASEDGMPRSLPDGGASAHFARHDPARVLAQCAGYRSIVGGWPDPFGAWTAEQADAARAVKDATLRALATIWADHPDYDERWRP